MHDPDLYRTELIARVRAVTNDIAWATRDLPEDAARTNPTPGEWSIHEHLSHLRDMEQEVILPLLRWATLPDMLDPRDYNRREWHERRYNSNEPIVRIMNDIFRMRDEELGVFEQLSLETWSRYREDTRWGPLTCQWIAELAYRHALDHLQCVMALRQEVNLATAQEEPLIVGGVIGGVRR